MRNIILEYTGIDIKNAFETMIALVFITWIISSYKYLDTTYALGISSIIIIVYTALHVNNFDEHDNESKGIYREFFEFITNALIVLSLGLIGIIFVSLIMKYIKPIIGSIPAFIVVGGFVYYVYTKYENVIGNFYHKIAFATTNRTTFTQKEIDLYILNEEYENNPNEYTVNNNINLKLLRIKRNAFRLMIIGLSLIYILSINKFITMENYYVLLVTLGGIFLFMHEGYTRFLRGKISSYDNKNEGFDSKIIGISIILGSLMSIIGIYATLIFGFIPETIFSIGSKGEILQMSSEAKTYAIITASLLFSPYIYIFIGLIGILLSYVIVIPVLHTYVWIRNVLLPLIGLVLILAIWIFGMLQFLGLGLAILEMFLPLLGVIFILIILSSIFSGSKSCQT